MAPKYPHVETPAEWFVAFTNPQRETTTADWIRRRAFSSYVPAMTVTRTVRRRPVSVSRPLFPRYIFVGLARGQNLLGLRQTPGLEGMVRTAGRPVTVEGAMLDGIRAAEAAGAYDFTDEREAVRAAAAKTAQAAADYAAALRDLQPGASVRVLEGPFKSFLGTVDHLLLPDRVAVTIRLFGSRHPVPMLIKDVCFIKKGCR